MRRHRPFRFEKRPCILHVAMLIVSIAAQEGRTDVRGWFEENWFSKAPLERPADETFGETNVTFAAGRVSIPLEVQLPERRPAPVIIQLCFGDEEPLPEATKQGFALVRWQMDSVARNPRKTKEPFDIALNPVFREYGPKERTDTSWGSVAAWAWGFRRVVDWVETRPELDSKRIAIVGFSRAGKAALWAGAQDERIALTVSCQSGCGGAMALKAHAEGAETLERLGVNFPNWMAGRLYAMAGKEDALEYDAADLLRLFAPRKVLVLSANDAKWLGPEAEQAAAKEAGVLHWTRPGKHSMTADDWHEIFKAAKDTYVFAYFGNEREGMKLAVSEDGLQWRELNGGRPVLVPEVGKEKLLRDPSVVQGPVRRSLPFRVRKQALQIVGSLFGGENRPCNPQEGFSIFENVLAICGKVFQA